jgi:hypothetical protein
MLTRKNYTYQDKAIKILENLRDNKNSQFVLADHFLIIDKSENS